MHGVQTDWARSRVLPRYHRQPTATPSKGVDTIAFPPLLWCSCPKQNKNGQSVGYGLETLVSTPLLYFVFMSKTKKWSVCLVSIIAAGWVPPRCCWHWNSILLQQCRRRRRRHCCVGCSLGVTWPAQLNSCWQYQYLKL